MPRRKNHPSNGGTISDDCSTESSAQVPLAKPKEDGSVLGARLGTIILFGSARLPEEAVDSHGCNRLTIEIEINPVDSTIIDISCTGILSLEEKILRGVLLGKSVEQAIKNAVLQVNERFFTGTKKTLIAALQDVYRHFQNEC